jgi:nitronate monooxygenase/enoyl-[acyl-carrier protein] reductase II
VLKTRLTELLDIEHPIILAAMGSATSASFAAAASNAGALGSIGTMLRPPDAVKRDLDMIGDLTQRPFAVNHIPHMLDEASFQQTLDLKPAVVSFALSDPGALVRRVHDAGSLAMAQVTTVAQAVEAVDHGVDIVIAQGGEAGGYGGAVSTITLVPQVVDAVTPVPVIAAGGIFDGRGLAAALMLGAAGVNMGTRFLASQEAPIAEGWQRAVLAARSEDTLKADAFNAINPAPAAGGYDAVLRSIKTPWLEEWNAKLDDAARERERLMREVIDAARGGRSHELILTAGQSAGGVHDVLPAADIIQRVVQEAEGVLGRA